MSESIFFVSDLGPTYDTFGGYARRTVSEIGVSATKQKQSTAVKLKTCQLSSGSLKTLATVSSKL